MNATKWIRILAVTVVAALPFNLTAAYDDQEITAEGYDLQTPEEIEKARQEIEATFGNADVHMMSEGEKLAVLAKYNYMDPQSVVPTDLLEKALLYFDKNKDKFPNQNYITIVDFKPRSDKYRLFVVEVATGNVAKYHTTHGVGSDKNKNGYAEAFGNIVNSGMSSLGYVRVSEVYSGKFGRSIRLDGLSDTNSKIRARAVVLHGWKKTYEKDVIQGLSWGCITLDYAIRDDVLDKVKEGSLMYVGVAGK